MNQKHIPAISVIVPTHNRPEMLDEALASVRAQTFTDFEIIVISNGEDNETCRASQKVAFTHRATYAQMREGNVSAARNYGIAHAKGKWIAFLDDDDLWDSGKLRQQIFEAEWTGADFITSDYAEFFPNGSQIVQGARLYPGWTHTWALNRLYWWAAPSAVMIRKSVLAELGGFDPRLRYSEDNDMWRRVSWRHKIHEMPEVLMYCRRGHPSLTTQERKMRFYDLIHYRKMRRDTPSDLRSTLPSAISFVLPRIAVIVTPGWLYPLLHRIKPRTRLLALRHRLRWGPYPWLRPRTRLQQLRHWLRWGPHPWLRPRSRWMALRRRITQ